MHAQFYSNLKNKFKNYKRFTKGKKKLPLISILLSLIFPPQKTKPLYFLSRLYALRTPNVIWEGTSRGSREWPGSPGGEAGRKAPLPSRRRWLRWAEAGRDVHRGPKAGPGAEAGPRKDGPGAAGLRAQGLGIGWARSPGEVPTRSGAGPSGSKESPCRPEPRWRSRGTRGCLGQKSVPRSFPHCLMALISEPA